MDLKSGSNKTCDDFYDDCWIINTLLDTSCIHGLMQERRNSSALAMELHLFALTHRYVTAYKSFCNIVSQVVFLLYDSSALAMELRFSCIN